MNTGLLGELERIFKEEFLKAAPLYQASSKVKLPYEDLHRPTLMYNGSLKQVMRQVDQLADYESFKTSPETDELIDLATKFGQQAGTYVDGCIRAENIRSAPDGVVGDPRDTRNVKVIDVFEHSDGRRNLQVFLVESTPKISLDEAIGWFGYKFYFAAAAIVMEYQAAKG